MCFCGIRELPDCFDKLKKLMELNFSNNSIVSIPESLSKLNLLRTFLIDGSKLFPSIGTITFDDFMNYSRMLFFPSFEDKLAGPNFKTEIEAMMAEKCGIHSFSTVPVENPSDIKKLNVFIAKECRRFESTASKLDFTPAGIALGHGCPLILFQMKHLENLSLCYQHIQQIPKEVNNLAHLKQLNLTGCPYLQEVSEQLASIKTIERELYLINVVNHFSIHLQDFQTSI